MAILFGDHTEKQAIEKTKGAAAQDTNSDHLVEKA